jgi:predicted dehydrogenase/threonine dehydrogenase-like Zn-dependent dehydrogenase
MKQVAQTQRDGNVHLEDVPAPSLRPGGILVQTAFSLISAGTERAKVELAQKNVLQKALERPEQARQAIAMLQQQGPVDTYRKVMNRLTALEPLGYSCSGVVLAVGDGAQAFRVGDQVACAGAGYANHSEVNFVPRNLCVKLPLKGAHDVQLDEAAYTTVGAIAMQGFRQAEVRLGEIVGVIGLGLIGLITVQILRAAGCRVLGIDLNVGRCKLAEALGADVACAANASHIGDIVPSVFSFSGCDAVIVTAATSSSDPLFLAGQLCRDRGRVVVVGSVGMSVPRQIYYDKELQLLLSRSYGPGRYDTEYEEKGRDYPIGYVRWTETRNMQAFLELISAAKLDVRALTTHRFKLECAPDAYHLITEGNAPYLGVLLEYPAGSAVMENTGASAPVPTVDVDRPAYLPATGKVRVALIGAGNFAQGTLLPILKNMANVELCQIATASGLTARSVASLHGIRTVAADSTAILNDQGVDTVFILTRHDSHASLVVQALKNRKRVFVEKPLALNEEQLQNIISAHQRESFLMVGFNRRFAPATRRVREFCESVKYPLSILCRVNAGYVSANHWVHDPVLGGGRIIGEACHFVDLILFLAADAPVEVSAYALPDEGRYFQDNVVAQIRFRQGSVGTLQYLANGDKRLGKEYIEVFGGGGTAIIDDFRRVKISRDGAAKKFGHGFSIPDKGHKGQLEAFVGAIAAGTPSPIPLKDLIMSTRITLKIRESIQLGRPVSV